MVLIDHKTGKTFREIHTENGKVFLLPTTGKVSDLEAGIIITCKSCGKKEIVNQGSMCHKLKLCTTHARQEIRKRLKIKRRRNE